MASVEDIVKAMEAGSEIRFADLFRVCAHYFGAPRNKGGSHYTFKTPWLGNPRINIQSSKGKAKAYQVGQVLAALAKLQAAIDEAAATAASSATPRSGAKPAAPLRSDRRKKK